MKSLFGFKQSGKCKSCLTGKELYELDKREPMCPYISCYENKNCPLYVKIKNPKKGL